MNYKQIWSILIFLPVIIMHSCDRPGFIRFPDADHSLITVRIAERGGFPKGTRHYDITFVVPPLSISGDEKTIVESTDIRRAYLEYTPSQSVDLKGFEGRIHISGEEIIVDLWENQTPSSWNGRFSLDDERKINRVTINSLSANTQGDSGTQDSQNEP